MAENLNSLLIEGVLINSPKSTSEEPTCVEFSIKNSFRYTDSNGEKQSKLLVLPVITYGELAEKVLRHLKPRMHTRVVGRLVFDEQIKLQAKHIEYRKPKATKLSAIYEEDGE